MFTITRQEEIDALRRDRSVVSVYLDRGYNEDINKMVFSQRYPFDRHVRDAWHILIPYCDGGYVDNETIYVENYGFELAEKLISASEIATDELPAILFNNYGGDADNMRISLNGLSMQAARNVIGRVGDIITRQHKDGRSDPDEFRQDAIEAVRRDLRLQRVVRFGKRALGPALAALSLLVPFT